jgi:hypothetical protein
MADDLNLDSLAADITKAATECNAKIIPAFLAGSEHALRAVVEAHTLADLVHHIRPRLVYLDTLAFDADEQIDAEFDQEDDDWIPEQKQLKALARKWKAHYGQTYRLTFELIADGVLHVAILDTEWFEDFQAEFEAIKEAIEDDRDDAVSEMAAEQRRDLADKVKQLFCDPRFSAPKASHSKRAYLARSLFPDLNSRQIETIVDDAESAQWLASAG